MNKIASFQVNHLDLLPGLYLSRQDRQDQCTVSTFDLRVTAPNREPVMDTPAIHTIEHLGATFLRNSSRKEEIIYFGPMGCRTGFYLVVFGDQTAEDVCPLVLDMCDFILDFEGEIPGASPRDCGNYLDMNLSTAKWYARRYLKDVLEHPAPERLIYPD